MSKYTNIAKGNARVGVQVGGKSIRQTDDTMEITYPSGAREIIVNKANGRQDITFTDRNGSRTYENVDPNCLRGYEG